MKNKKTVFEKKKRKGGGYPIPPPLYDFSSIPVNIIYVLFME